MRRDERYTTTARVIIIIILLKRLSARTSRDDIGEPLHDAILHARARRLKNTIKSPSSNFKTGLTEGARSPWYAPANGLSAIRFRFVSETDC